MILRPGLFMQNVLGQAAAIKTDSKMVLPFAKDLPVALIDVRDTGAVGARILVDPAPHAGKTYEFTGKLTTYGAFAEVFSQVLGRPITYVGITPEQAEQGMKSRGMPDWLVAHLVTIAKVGVSRRLLDREHQADRGPRRARADHNQTIRRGFQGAVCLVFLPREAGKGDRALARWKGRRPRGKPPCSRPPPPRFAWSPSPATLRSAGADEAHRADHDQTIRRGLQAELV